MTKGALKSLGWAFRKFPWFKFFKVAINFGIKKSMVIMFSVICLPKELGAGIKIHLLEKANQQQINKAVLSVDYLSG